MAARSLETRSGRPKEVVAASVLLALLAGHALLVLATTGPRLTPVGLVGLGILVIVHALPAYGLLRRRQWARRAALAILSVRLILALGGLSRALNGGDQWMMGVNVVLIAAVVWIVSALWRDHDVKAHFATPVVSPPSVVPKETA